MPASYLPYEPDQDLLLLVAEGTAPEGHLAYFINDTVNRLDLCAFHAHYGCCGW